MSATPDSTLDNREQLIANLQRQLAESRAERDEAQRQLDERTIERDEALAQRTATSEVLQVINSSPGDLASVFDAMLEKATRLCEADFGILLTHKENQYRAAGFHNVPPAYQELLRDPIRPGAKTALARVAGGEPVAQIVDIAADEELLSEPMVHGALQIAGFRTMLAVPLRQEGNLLGAFTIYRQEVRPFTDKQIALLQNFAAHAVIAMENARLLTETRVALEQQTATAEVLQVINSSPGDLAPVFKSILEKAHAFCGSAHGGLMLREGEELRVVAAHGETRFIEAWRALGGVRPPPGSLMAGLVAGERLIHLPDAQAHDGYRNMPTELQHLFNIGNVRTFLVVPLRKDGALLGTISAFRQEVRPFTEKQIAILENFAAQAVIAMENARLLGELHQRTDEVAELNRGLEARVAEQVEELGRVGRLKRFLAPQLAELIVSQGDEKILESHRREIVVVFCDLRGYTAFTETAEPEEVLDFLREYHGALGPLVAEYEGTLDQFSGDGIMVFFNDPLPIPDPAARAVEMAMAMREAASNLIAAWRRRGRELGFGAGIAQGYATLADRVCRALRLHRLHRDC